MATRVWYAKRLRPPCTFFAAAREALAAMYREASAAMHPGDASQCQASTKPGAWQQCGACPRSDT